MTEVLHPPAEDKRHFPPMPPMTAPMWFGVLCAPVIWGVQLQISYTLVPWICRHHGNYHWLLHLTSAVCAVLAALCAVICWRYLHPPGRMGDESPSSPPGTGSEQGGTPGRTYFLAVLGLLTGSLFTLVILAQGVASFFLDPCLM